jgi:hypothetical protein
MSSWTRSFTGPGTTTKVANTVMTTMIAISKRSVTRRFIRRTRTYLVNANMPSVFRANGASHIEAEK